MTHREQALVLWTAAVDSVRPEPLVREAIAQLSDIRDAARIIIVGAGKAGVGMVVGLEQAFAGQLDRVEGIVNVPAGMTAPPTKVLLHAARPLGVNEPTAEGVAGAEEMLRLVSSAGPNDVAVCLLSGGGSALLPAPVAGVTLQEKLAVTRLLHRCGATIDEMNCVRKHLSRIKGGRLAEAFTGKQLVSLIVSDVVGDPLDVIASGPTAPDPTDFRTALNVFENYSLLDRVPAAVLAHLEAGVAGRIPETPKALKPAVMNRVIGSNRGALEVAHRSAEQLGYRVLNLGSFIEGDTEQVATTMAGIVRSIRLDGVPFGPPACLLLGGETTVRLNEKPGKGGRNQEFVLALLTKLGRAGMQGVIVLSGGTDGEDGPTDAAGAIADRDTFARFDAERIHPEAFLRQHDSYHLFERVGGLIRCGLTGTNVMDIRLVLIA